MGTVNRATLAKAYALLNLVAALYIFVFFGIYFDGARHGTASSALMILPGCPLWLAEAVARMREAFKKPAPVAAGTQRYVVTPKESG
jgi:hypothetical protein